MLMVSFDLPHPVPGDRRYKAIDRYLSAIGTVMRPLKQVRFVMTRAHPDVVLQEVRSRIGARGAVAVVRVSRRSAVFVNDAAIRASVRKAIRQAGSR
ncbi:hypothetical protein BWQ93_03330 [Sphingopyxis sp. QXT-31]|nr:hypothetical protein BWQ93_03330 [Sphingopyxis sp. QXT-31]